MFHKTFQFAVLLFCGVVFVASDSYEPHVQTTVVKGVPGWISTPYPFINLGEKLYYFENDLKLNWFEAGDACRRKNAHLATIEDALEKQHILDYLHKKKRTVQYWTSGNDLGQHREFKWAGTGNPIVYSFWGENQPDNSNDGEHCVDLTTIFTDGSEYDMNDQNCLHQMNFICEVTGASTVAVTVW